MASEIFFLAAALILLVLGGVDLPAVALRAVAGRGFSWDLICAISSSVFARSASSPFKASSSTRILVGTLASPLCERKILARPCESHWLTVYESLIQKQRRNLVKKLFTEDAMTPGEAAQAAGVVRVDRPTLGCRKCLAALDQDQESELQSHRGAGGVV